MSTQQDRTGIAGDAGIDQDFVDGQPASTSPKIAVPESSKFGGEPDLTKDHLDIGESNAEVSPVLPEADSLMEPDYDEICIICRDPSDRTSMREAVPCGHKFHEDCILEWVEKTPFSKGLCPYCTIAVYALANTDAKASKYTIKPTSIPGRLPESDDVDDNDLSPYMRELNEHRNTEERRIQALTPTASKHSATYLEFCIREDPWIIRVQRTIKLKMRQQGTFVPTFSETKVTLGLFVKYYDMRENFCGKPWEELTISTDPKTKQEYENAKKEVTEAAEKYIRIDQGIDWARLRQGHYYIPGGERGIVSKIEPEVKIFISPKWPNTRPEEFIDDDEGPYASVEWVTPLQEWGVALPDGQIFHPKSTPSERVTEYTRQTYELHKAAMEWFFEKRGEKFKGRPFDRGTTNVLEPCKPGGKCGYCKEEHRTGDCLLPWDVEPLKPDGKCKYCKYEHRIGDCLYHWDYDDEVEDSSEDSESDWFSEEDKES